MLTGLRATVAIAFAAFVCVATPSFATSFLGDVTISSDAASDQALVIVTNPTLGTSIPLSFSLNQGQFLYVPSLFKIGTPEGSVGFPLTDPADTAAFDIFAAFSFDSPASSATAEGYTRGRWLLQDGILRWDSPILMSFGDKGKLAIFLFDTNFPLAGHLVDVAAKFWLKEDASPIPIPAALPLFAGGLGLMGWLARRKRRQAAHA
jgi:hypothetical protein